MDTISAHGKYVGKYYSEDHRYIQSTFQYSKTEKYPENVKKCASWWIQTPVFPLPVINWINHEWIDVSLRLFYNYINYIEINTKMA